MESTVQLIADGDDLILPLSEDICTTLGWAVGDTIEWRDNNDGSITLTKKQPAKVQVLVETVRIIKTSYIVTTPLEHVEWARDTVTMQEADPVVEECLDEIITSHRAITHEEAKKIRGDTDE